MPSTANPTLAQLIRQTARLRRDLRALMTKFPEDDLELGDRIFVRLLNPVWRNPSGKSYDPKQRKQIAAIEWIEGYQNYIRDVEALISGVMLKPELFNTLPMHGLPNVPQFQYSADECIRRLDLQRAALKKLQGEEAPLESGDDGRLSDRVEDLRGKLHWAVKRFTLEVCVAKAGLNRDTINDFRTGKTKPHKKTTEKVEKYLKTLPLSASRRDGLK